MGEYRAALETGLETDQRPGWLKVLDAYELEIRSKATQEPETLRRDTLAKRLLDLHRCEHGRLEGDPCFGCGGPSKGNMLLPPGMTIGHTVNGKPIVVPHRDDHDEPKAWLPQ